MLAIYALFLLVLLIADASAREKEAKRLQLGKFVGEAKDELNLIMRKTRNSEIIALLDDLKAKLETTPLETSSEALPIEDEIIKQIKRIKVSAEMKDAERVAQDVDAAKDLIDKRTSAVYVG